MSSFFSTEEISKIVRKIGERHLREMEILRSVVRQRQESIRIISETLRPHIEILQGWIQQQSEILFEVNRKYWESFKDLYGITGEEALQILRDYKWFISPSMPFAFAFEAVKIGRQKGNQRKAMNDLFVGYFWDNNFENLETLVEGWKANSIFTRRMKIFRDCISALRDAKRGSNLSNLVIPTLIAQIDGVRQDFMEQKGLYFDLKGKQWKDSSGQPLIWEDQKKWFRKQTPNQSLLDLANDIFLDILFQTAYRGEQLKIPFTFSRHKVMHGEYKRYGTKDNTIRAFLVLDFLASLK